MKPSRDNWVQMLFLMQFQHLFFYLFLVGQGKDADFDLAFWLLSQLLFYMRNSQSRSPCLYRHMQRGVVWDMIVTYRRQWRSSSAEAHENQLPVLWEFSLLMLDLTLPVPGHGYVPMDKSYSRRAAVSIWILGAPAARWVGHACPFSLMAWEKDAFR